ncbi:hypothetical protein [Sediminivirga luteola]|uniref:hypothetical protein n=1 Tax=Sediminivirga luteola TaxID=1774748 RepID=UPI001F5690CF|nr:hypothetical protein [Sediminivirga luteola]MCI2266970.1 hypothetical protein [Sediminivirga luteola]
MSHRARALGAAAVILTAALAGCHERPTGTVSPGPGPTTMVEASDVPDGNPEGLADEVANGLDGDLEAQPCPVPASVVTALLEPWLGGGDVTVDEEESYILLAQNNKFGIYDHACRYSLPAGAFDSDAYPPPGLDYRRVPYAENREQRVPTGENEWCLRGGSSPEEVFDRAVPCTAEVNSRLGGSEPRVLADIRAVIGSDTSLMVAGGGEYWMTATLENVPEAEGDPSREAALERIARILAAAGA